MDIKPNDLVLEIGSGNNPHPRANILCDRYLHDNSDRAGGFPAVVDRPFVVADGQKLPFGDKQFDYVICSHILEHIQNPERFIAEATRVGKRGCIEVPSIVSERIFGWDIHHWHIDRSGGRLRLWKKKEGERFGGFFHRLIANEIWFRRFFEEHESEWYVRFEWTNTIKYVISKRGIPSELLNAIDRKAWKRMSEAQPSFVDDLIFYCRWMMRRLVKKTIKTSRQLAWNIRVFISPKTLRSNLVTILLCPRCHGNLIDNASRATVCKQCATAYAFDGVIPIMILPGGRKGV